MEERREGPPFAAFAQSFQGRRKKRKNGGNNTPTKLFSSAPNSASCLPCPLATLIASKRARWTQRAETGPRARGLQKDQIGSFGAILGYFGLASFEFFMRFLGLRIFEFMEFFETNVFTTFWVFGFLDRSDVMNSEL